jgi:hypothetical protein
MTYKVTQSNQSYSARFNSSPRIKVQAINGGETRLEFLDDVERDSVKQDGYIIQYNSSSGKFIGTSYVLSKDSQWVTTAVGINTISNVGIGTTIPTSKLTVSGDVLVSGIITSRDYNSTSDLRLKTNIKAIEDPISKVLTINGVLFDWKDTGKTSGGVIAQEVEVTLPELIESGEIKRLNYNGLIGLLVEVVKEQQKTIEGLEKRMISLENK